MRYSEDAPAPMHRPLILRAPRTLGLGFAVALAFGAAQAQVVVASSLADLSLEQLANVEVTSVSKRPQRLAEVSATVYVISSDDIRRSGATSLPEALRLAPNLLIARADANQYAITARGFNSVLANKILVLVDGRTVYSPLFSGVFWEAQDVLLEDVERIEVLSGPGGTLYGSNAVNGVINIITRSAADTQGVLLAAGAGTEDRALAARYGGTTAGGVAWRGYVKHARRDNTEMANGAMVRDAARRTQAGFRADRSDSRDQFTLQGDAYESDIDQAPAARRITGANLLGRWTRSLGGASRAQVQAYYDHTGRDQPGSVRDTLDTWDIEFQHLLQPRPGHDFIWGAGYRMQRDRVDNINPAVLAILPADQDLHLGNVFAQDEVALRDGLRLTLGVKAEHNRYTGMELLPNARLAWDVAPNHLLWAAVSRTVRTPSRVDREFFSPGVPPFALAGGAGFRSEVARVVEVGWRGQPRPALSFSVTLYHHDFDALRSVDLQPGGATFNNNFSGTLDGVTAWGHWRVSDTLRLSASYLNQRGRFQAEPGTAPLGGVASLGNDPRYQWSTGASWDVAPRVEVDVQVRGTGALPNPAVPAYTALDARLGWRVRRDLELSIAGRNLGDPRHPEWGSPLSRAEFTRSVFVQATWRM
jgi:iron complex outermembrane receptor protein